MSVDRATASLPPVEPEVTEWATEAARSVLLARRGSRLCFGLAIASFLVGLVMAVALFLGYYNADDGSGEFQIRTNSFDVAQALSPILASMTPIGVLLAAGVGLRLMAARFETDLYSVGDPEPDDDPDLDPEGA